MVLCLLLQYISQPSPVGGNSNGVQKRSYTRHVIAAVVGVVLVALLIGGVLGGIYLQNQSTKDLIKVPQSAAMHLYDCGYGELFIDTKHEMIPTKLQIDDELM